MRYSRKWEDSWFGSSPKFNGLLPEPYFILLPRVWKSEMDFVALFGNNSVWRVWCEIHEESSTEDGVSMVKNVCADLWVKYSTKHAHNQDPSSAAAKLQRQSLWPKLCHGYNHLVLLSTNIKFTVVRGLKVWLAKIDRLFVLASFLYV